MKEIQLTQGRVAVVDDEDYEYLNQWKWHVSKFKNGFYACRTDNKNKIQVRMHRVILGLTDSKILCDHRDRNGLNNQRRNLRISDKSKNRFNSTHRKNTSSKYNGVAYHKKLNKWMARIHASGNKKYLGIFINEKDAAIAYNKAALKMHGEFASLNKIVA